MQVRLLCNWEMARRSSCLRSKEMEAVMVSELRRMPKKVRDVAGPSVFSSLMGMLVTKQTRFMASMFCWHMLELAGPAVKKSSR